MHDFLLPLLALLLIGGAATAWFLGARLPREQRASGILALSGMHWREFQRLVVAAMQARGFWPRAAAGDPASDGLIELEREGGLWLLSTKHGTGYVPGPQAITDFANTVHLRGGAGGMMATLGSVEAQNVALARVQRIELLDGRTLWSEIAPLLEPIQRDAILGPARRRAKRQLLLSWALALAAALAIWLGRPHDDAAPAPAADRAPANAHPQPPAGAPGPAAPAASAAAVDSGAVPTDEAALAERRRRVAGAIASLPFVERAGWSTRSTLVVRLAGDADADKRSLCRLIEPYAELRASRLQVEPPPGSQRQVRFFQCSSY